MHTQHLAQHALDMGSGDMSPGKFWKSVLLTLNLEAVLMENYEAVKLMVGGYLAHPPPLDQSLVTALNNCFILKLPVIGHSRHCPVEANDTPDNS